MRRSRNLQNQEGRISNSSSGKQYSKTAIDQPEEWRLEAALVSLLTLTCGDKRLVCAPFRVLPNIQEFPHYYETIKTPIDLKSIAKNIREGNYNSWDAIKGDVELLCKNAKEFNESSSMVYKTASQLLQHFQTKVSELSQVRRFSARVISRNRELIDDLLRSTVSEFLQYSEDSLSEEDGENSEEVSEAGNSVNNEDSEEDEYSEIEDDSEVEDSSEVNDSEQNDVSEEDEDAHTQENEVLMEVEAVAINGVEKADDKGNILRRTKPAIKLEASIEEEKEQPHETIQENGYGPGNGKKNAQTRLVSNDHQTSTSMPEIPLRRSSKRRRLMSPDNTMIEKKKPDQKSVDDMRCEDFIKVLRGVWHDVRSLKLGNRSLSLPFLYLPSKKMFPDYYTITEKPMSLACIKNKIDQSKYHDFVEMLRDMKTMCENARRYNRLGSQIHNDSYIVESVAGGSMQMHTINSPYRQSGKDWIEQFSAISNADTSVDVTNVKEDVKHSVSSVASSSNAPTSSGSQTITTAVVGLQTTSTHPPQGDSIPTTSIAADPPQQKLAPQNELHHSNTHRPHSYFTLQPPPQLEQTQFINSCQEQQPSTSTALYQHSNATLVHTQANSAETVQNSNLQQQLIHPGRLIPCARPKLTEPVFTATSKSIYIQRIVHSETYLKYIESMFNDGAKQRTISKWDKSLLASQRNTVVPSHRRLPYDWIHQSANLSKSKPKEEGIVRALWKLRDQLVEGTADINRNPGNQAEAIPPFPKNNDITCSGGKQRQANAAPIIPY